MVFDDSCPSHREVAVPALLERGLVGTFYILPASKFHDAGFWSSVVREPGVVLANHTFTHAGARSVEEAEEDILRADRLIDELERAGRPEGEVVDPNDAAYGAGRAVTAEELGAKQARRARSFCIPGGVPWLLTPAQTRGLMEKYHLIHRPRTRNYRADTMSAEELLGAPDRALAAGSGIGQPDGTPADPEQLPAQPLDRPFPPAIHLPGYLMFHGVGGDWISTDKDLFLRLLDRLVAMRDQLWVTDPVSWQLASQSKS